MGDIMSKKFSLQGWSFVEWIKGNKTTIVELAKVGIPYLLSRYVSPDPVIELVITGLGKLALDAVHYWANEQ